MILYYVDCFVMFGQFFIVIVIDYRNVCVNWYWCFQGFKNVDLVWCVVDMVFVMDNVGDFYILVIDNYIEVIGWGIIGMVDNKIVQFLVVEFDWIMDLIVKNNRIFLWVSKMYNIWFIISMMFMVVVVVIVIMWFFIFCYLFFVQCFQVFFRVIVFISSVFFQYLIDYCVVVIKMFGLVVRIFILFQVQLVYVIYNGFDSFWCGMFKIGVFNMQYEFIVVVMCKKLGVKSSMCVVNVQIVCWVWCEVSFDFYEMVLCLERC